jgi:hypothetical protein
MEKVDLYCKGHRISRSEFAREAFKIALEKAKSSEKHGFVYFIRAESTYKFKIGYSKDPDRRMTEIDPTSPFELHIYHQIEAKNAERLEYELHKHFAKSLLKNEWYSLDDSDLAWLKGEGYRSIPHIATHIL